MDASGCEGLKPQPDEEARRVPFERLRKAIEAHNAIAQAADGLDGAAGGPRATLERSPPQPRAATQTAHHDNGDEAARRGSTRRAVEPECERIEALRASGGSLESLALKFRGHKDAIWRHWRDHVSADLKTSYLAGPATIAALKERAVAEGGSLLDQLCSFAAGSTNSPDRLDAMVWAFTQLMVGAQNDGIIRFYVEENARLRSEWSVGAAGGPRIRIEAPPGISCVQVKSGRSVAIPEYRIVELDDFDAKLLVAVGWRAIDPLSA